MTVQRTVLAILLLCIPAVVLAADPPTVDVFGRAAFNMGYDDGLQFQDFSSYITDPDGDEVNFNPRDTRIGVRASTVDGEWTYGSVFEIDFYGSNASNNLLPRLRLGYAEAKKGALSIRGGQDWLPIAAMNPGTIDFGILSWAGNLWWRVPQFTLRYGSGGMQYTASVAKHRVSNAQEQQENMPWFMGRIAAKDVLADGTLLAVGAGARSVTVGDADYSPYVVVGEFSAKLGKTVLKAEGYMGRGVGREFVHYGLDYNPDHPDGALAIDGKGGFVSLGMPVADRVEINAGYGFDDPDDADLDVQAGGAFAAPYLKNTALFANVKVKVTKNFGWGLELTDYTTTVVGGEDWKGKRGTFAWWFVF